MRVSFMWWSRRRVTLRVPLVGLRLLASPGCNAPGLHPAASVIDTQRPALIRLSYVRRPRAGVAPCTGGGFYI